MLTRFLIALVRFWQVGPSAVLPPSCRYDPTCSVYAITALRRYGLGAIEAQLARLPGGHRPIRLSGARHRAV